MKMPAIMLKTDLPHFLILGKAICTRKKTTAD